jgi:hypothetical protein
MVKEGDIVIFPKDNDIHWSQDFSYYTASAPADIQFIVKNIIRSTTKTATRVALEAPGYGQNQNYGNGRVFVDYDDADFFVQGRIDSNPIHFSEQLLYHLSAKGICPRPERGSSISAWRDFMRESYGLELLSEEDYNLMDEEE